MSVVDAILLLMVDVVSTVIVRGGRILLAQRPAHKSFPLTWETPGGKVEPGETRPAAVRRECHEELGLLIGGVGDYPVWAGSVVPDGGTKEYYITVWEALDFTGEPTPREGQGIGWFLPHELQSLNLAPGTGRASDAIRGVLLRRPQ